MLLYVYIFIYLFVCPSSILLIVQPFADCSTIWGRWLVEFICCRERQSILLSLWQQHTRFFKSSLSLYIYQFTQLDRSLIGWLYDDADWSIWIWFLLWQTDRHIYIYIQTLSFIYKIIIIIFNIYTIHPKFHRNRIHYSIDIIHKYSNGHI